MCSLILSNHVSVSTLKKKDDDDNDNNDDDDDDEFTYFLSNVQTENQILVLTSEQ